MTVDRSEVDTATDVVRMAERLGLSIAVAESLTGGLLADALVSVPGASRVFSGGVIAYSTELKHTLLGVDDERLRRTGPVDGEVARQMARGVRDACALATSRGGGRRPTDIGVATTGVAGPDPDPQTGQAPGTVWVSLSGSRGDMLESLALHGTREEIRRATVGAAVSLLLRYLSHVDSSSGKFQE